MASPILQTTTGSISWSAGANWSTLAKPTTSDTGTVANSAATIDSGFLNTATLTSLSVHQNFTGTCGLAAQAVKAVTSITRSSNTATVTTTAAHGYTTGDTVVVSGAVETDYNGTYEITVTGASTFTYAVANTPSTPATGTILVEKYAYLIQPVTTFNFGTPSQGAPAGSTRWKHDFSTVQVTANVFNTSQANSDSFYEPLRLLGSNASNALNIMGGTVGLATTRASETCTFATINMTGGTLNGGSGLTWSTVTQSGGTLTLNSGAAAGTLTVSGGTCNLKGTGTVATVRVGGTLNLTMRASSGSTISNLVLDNGATLDVSGNPAAITITSGTVNGNVTIITNPGNPAHLVFTNALSRSPDSQVTFK